MREFLIYLFWPNPGGVTYGSVKVSAILIVCVILIGAWLVLRQWRKGLTNPVTKKLSRSWPGTALWFGVIGLFLLVSRVEMISYVSMRFLWVIWLACLILYVAFQVRRFRARHYEKIDTPAVEDPREKYLPKQKRRK